MIIIIIIIIIIMTNDRHNHQVITYVEGTITFLTASSSSLQHCRLKGDIKADDATEDITSKSSSRVDSRAFRSLKGFLPLSLSLFILLSFSVRSGYVCTECVYIMRVSCVSIGKRLKGQERRVRSACVVWERVCTEWRAYLLHFVLLARARASLFIYLQGVFSIPLAVICSTFQSIAS